VLAAQLPGDESRPSLGHAVWGWASSRNPKDAVEPTIAAIFSFCLSVDEYARLGNRVPLPRPRCIACDRPMCFDGSYRRQVRHNGVVHRVTIRRVRCPSCGLSCAVLPEFVLVGRLDSVDTIGAALVTATGAPRTEAADRLFAGVPARTVRSWKARFTERAPLLGCGLASFAVHWGGEVPPASPDPVIYALTSLGAAWVDPGRSTCSVAGHSPLEIRQLDHRRGSLPPAWICRGQGDIPRRYPPGVPDQGRQGATG